MNGRLEKEIKIEKKIEERLKGKPALLTDYAESFMNETYNTKLSYINNVIKFTDFLKTELKINIDKESDLNRISATHINKYLKSIRFKNNVGDNNIVKNSNSYISNVVSSIKHFFTFLSDNKLIQSDPCIYVKNPKDNTIHEITSLTESEIKLINDNIRNGIGSKRSQAYQKGWNTRDLAIFNLGITTGLRVSAICNINIEDIDFKNKKIVVIEKGNIQKEVFIPDSTMKLINDWIAVRNEKIYDKNGALFISNRKERLNTASVRVMLRKYTRNINKKITPHKLRSTTATNLYEKTEDIYLVANVLGHKNIQNTERYAKMSNEKKRMAADILGSLIK